MKMKNNTPKEAQLGLLQQRYAGRGKEGKTRLLDEFCDHYGYERKHAVKLLGGYFSQRAKEKETAPAKPSRYQPIEEVVARIWKAGEQLCGKRLQPALELWIPHYSKHYETLDPSQKKLLKEVSAATLDRMLMPLRNPTLDRLCGTRPGTLLRTQIPIQGEAWNQQRVGFMEADSVAHCGFSLAGDFVWSLTYTCLASGWTEGRAVWNKGAAGVLEQTQDVEESLPFKLLGMDFDNGGEWLNWHLVRYLQERIAPIKLTRSRPYHSDDNAHVEQKNWMWPRQLLGYGRLENPQAVAPINQLFKESWGPLHNFFLPSTKLISKERVGSQITRTHDRPQTAYQRVMATGQLNSKEKKHLREQMNELDPFELAKKIEKQLKPILRTSVD
jgi:hypothetical protein